MRGRAHVACALWECCDLSIISLEMRGNLGKNSKVDISFIALKIVELLSIGVHTCDIGQGICLHCLNSPVNKSSFHWRAMW